MRKLAALSLALLTASCGTLRNGGGFIPTRSSGEHSGYITVLEPGHAPERINVGKTGKETVKHSH